MDNFIDKLAHKLNAQDVIKANSQAEAAEMKKLQLQVAEYEKILQEMRKLNYKNVELSDKMDVLVGENASKIQSLQEDELKLLSQLRDLTEEQTRNIEFEISQKSEERDAAIQEALVKAQVNLGLVEEMFKHSEDFNHKENVKVYRNVQAVIIDELKKQTEKLVEENRKMHFRLNLACVMSALTFLVSVIGIIVQILTGFHIELF